jgi:Thiol-disulfide isomerase and thioredoxins
MGILKCTVLFPVLFLLVPSLGAGAQEVNQLNVGDTVPGRFWHQPVKMVLTAEKDNQSVSFGQYRGKLIILDFWATWCAPCVAAFPKMDSLRTRFKDQLAILPVTSQPSRTVAAFFGNMEKATSREGFSIVDDTSLRSFFPYRSLPHYVWIDGNGVVRAITGGEQVTVERISSLLHNDIPPSDIKKDVRKVYNYNSSLHEQIESESLLKHSTFSKYIEGYGSRHSIDKKQAKITLLNSTIAWLYRIAYSEFNPELLNPSRFVLEVKDSIKVTSGGLKGRLLKEWCADNAYCYELTWPGQEASRLFEQMRADLNSFFPYACNIENRPIRCLVLTKGSGKDRVATKGGKPELKNDAYSLFMRNLLWKNFTSLLNMYYLQKSKMPLIDETGINGYVDLDIKARMADPGALAVALSKYGLHLKEEVRELPVIVLRNKGTL